MFKKRNQSKIYYLSPRLNLLALNHDLSTLLFIIQDLILASDAFILSCL